MPRVSDAVDSVYQYIDRYLDAGPGLYKFFHESTILEPASESVMKHLSLSVLNTEIYGAKQGLRRFSLRNSASALV